MTDARRFAVAALVTLAMPLLTIGAPMLARASAQGADQATHHVEVRP